MATHAAGLLPDPDHEVGYSEALLADVLGEHIVAFRKYMTMKTYTISSDGPVYYPSDVRRFMDYYVTRTAHPLTEAEVRDLFDEWGTERRRDLH